MEKRPSERPEGERTSPRAETAWRLAREIIGLIAVWVIALYVVSRSRGDVTTAAITVSIGCFVALLAGFGVEAIVMRKAPTLWIGCFVLALWATWLPFAQPGVHLAIVGMLGLVIVAATPGAWRKRSMDRERAFLRDYPKWALRRHQMRRVLVVGMILGVALSVVWGIWNSVAVI